MASGFRLRGGCGRWPSPLDENVVPGTADHAGHRFRVQVRNGQKEARCERFLWFWSQLEPERGKYRWDIIDTALDQARRHGQKLDMRLMPYDQSNPLPQWYQNSGARRANRPTGQDEKVWSPDASDPLYIQA
ncbi:MAG TPA: beta-galactosidase [Candidatus Solibacter sp.]|jgi:hypothetical protein|nr:beta-galactosidase [Candidatus Solibacter sp.]